MFFNTGLIFPIAEYILTKNFSGKEGMEQKVMLNFLIFIFLPIVLEIIGIDYRLNKFFLKIAKEKGKYSSLT